MKVLVFASLLAMGMASCSFQKVQSTLGTRRVDHITCALRHCQLMVGGEFMAIALKGIVQPDLPGKCTAEGMIYISADIFMRNLFEKADRIEVGEFGEEVMIHSDFLSQDYRMKEAKIVVDGLDLAQMLSYKGFALLQSEITAPMKDDKVGVWCAALQQGQ